MVTTYCWDHRHTKQGWRGWREGSAPTTCKRGEISVSLPFQLAAWIWPLTEQWHHSNPNYSMDLSVYTQSVDSQICSLQAT